MTGTIVARGACRIPAIGFGTYDLAPGTTVAAVSAALVAGYRHIDAAQLCGN